MDECKDIAIGIRIEGVYRNIVVGALCSDKNKKTIYINIKLTNFNNKIVCLRVDIFGGLITLDRTSIGEPKSNTFTSRINSSREDSCMIYGSV